MRELATSLAGLVLIVSAVILLAAEVISFENALLLITMGLSVLGYNTLKTRRNTPAQVRKNLYKYRKLQPVVTVEDNKVILSICGDAAPQKLVEKLSKIYNKPVEVKKHEKIVPLSTLTMDAGDAIKPYNKPWEGSLGYLYKGHYYTNSHVVPQKNMYVQHVKTGKIFGRAVWVSRIRTVTGLQYFLSLFGYRIPANKTDAAKIQPITNITYNGIQKREEITQARPGDLLTAAGRTSGRREGVVESTDTTAVVEWGNGRYAVFEDIIKARFPARPGDSGGPVVNGEGKIVGLVFAGPIDGSFALIIKASNIEKEAS